MQLHGYFRSSAAYRVRIALNLKGVSVTHLPHHLRKSEQRDAAFLRINPQGQVPVLMLDDGAALPQSLPQSLAIIEWLNDTYPEPPLLPSAPMARARVRAFAQMICCDIHPVQNLKVLNRLRDHGLTEDAVLAWARWAHADGLLACEQMIAREDGPFCFGAGPTLADLCLVPQLVNARRFGIDLSEFPRLLAADAAANALPAFADAAPDRQGDAE